MARSHIGVALAAASFAIFIIIQLSCYFSLPEVGSWPWISAHRGVNGGEAFGIPTHGDDPKIYASRAGDQYLLGVGKADITGPVVEINLMGYANVSQVGSGLRQRLYSRAFIVGDVNAPNDRFVYLVLDTQSGDTAVRYGLLDRLRELGEDYAMYGQQNVAVTGTHSHSGPGAWLNYLLPQITSKGFDKQSYHAIVDGAVLSIQRAQESLAPGRLSIGTTKIKDANINRSLYAYLANPAEERQRYADSVDKTLTLLRFQRVSDGKDVGVLTWFPVHGTSMLGNNTIITGDNKGVAAYLFEQSVRQNYSNAAEGFVAGFSQSNVGDTSPNIMGAYCEYGPDAGKECSFENSTCGGQSQPCRGRGPYFGLNDAGTKSCFEIGRRQYAGARELLDSMAAGEETPVVDPTVRFLHTFVDLSNYSFPHPNGTLVHTCPAAMGYSFAAGTTDGPGAFDFTQNDPDAPNASPLWGVVSDLLHKPGPEQRACQAPKPILLDVGETHRPYEWTPNIVDIQLLRVGQLIIIVSPGEATTMSGRRWREAVAAAATSSNIVSAGSASPANVTVVLGGPANSYTHYIATEEEYAIQRYEGASTLHGPHTLNAYINLTLAHLPYLAADTPGDVHPPPLAPDPPGDVHPPPLAPDPPNNVNRSLSFITGVVRDSPGFRHSFGDVLDDVAPAYKVGDVASARFQGANPRNNLRLEGTYAAVERLDAGSRERVRVRDDGDWDLVFEWRRTSTLLATSEVRVSWEIGGGGREKVEEGRYRLRYWGDAKALGGRIEGFEGVSGEFDVSGR